MDEDISEEQRAAYLDAFNLFDTNHDGTITPQKLRDLMKKIGDNPSDSDLTEMISKIDTKGNGTIDFEDFVAMMERKNSEIDTEEELINAFKLFDKDGNGMISRKYIKSVMKALGDNLTGPEIDEMINEADVDGDGYLNYEEFVRMMMAK